jgi:hypothetical protein
MALFLALRLLLLVLLLLLLVTVTTLSTGAATGTVTCTVTVGITDGTAAAVQVRIAHITAVLHRALYNDCVYVEQLEESSTALTTMQCINARASCAVVQQLQLCTIRK